MMHVEVEASPCSKMTTGSMYEVISHWLSLHDHIVVKRARVWPSTRAIIGNLSIVSAWGKDVRSFPIQKQACPFHAVAVGMSYGCAFEDTILPS